MSTVEDTGLVERWPEFDHAELVAATLMQQPRYVGHEDGRWEANAAFIAHARQDIPWLLDEVTRLRARIDQLKHRE